jgi:hypothetical protein
MKRHPTAPNVSANEGKPRPQSLTYVLDSLRKLRDALETIPPRGKRSAQDGGGDGESR